MLQTDNIAESLQCNPRKPEITKLTVAFQICGIENDMIMNMSPVHMSCHDKCMFPFCESHTGFIPNFICFLYSNKRSPTLKPNFLLVTKHLFIFFNNLISFLLCYIAQPYLFFTIWFYCI